MRNLVTGGCGFIGRPVVAVVGGTDAVVHLAAETSVLGSMARSVRGHRVDLDVTAALLEGVRMARADFAPTTAT